MASRSTSQAQALRTNTAVADDHLWTTPLHARFQNSIKVTASNDESIFRINPENGDPPQARSPDLKSNSAYTYDTTRKLGALIPVEVETKVSKEPDISQVVINQVRAARGESSWMRKDVIVLRASALCEIAHYYRALKADLQGANNEAVVAILKFDRERIAMEIMKGLTVDEAFRKCCVGIDFDALKPDGS